MSASVSPVVSTGNDGVLREILTSLRRLAGTGHRVLLCFDDAHLLSEESLLHVVLPLLESRRIRRQGATRHYACRAASAVGETSQTAPDQRTHRRDHGTDRLYDQRNIRLRPQQPVTVRWTIRYVFLRRHCSDCLKLRQATRVESIDSAIWHCSWVTPNSLARLPPARLTPCPQNLCPPLRSRHSGLHETGHPGADDAAQNNWQPGCEIGTHASYGTQSKASLGDHIQHSKDTCTDNHICDQTV